MLPTFDPDELAPYTDHPQRRYAQRRRGDLRDRFNLHWYWEHQYSWRNFDSHNWNLWLKILRTKRWSAKIYPRYHGYAFTSRSINRRVRRRVRTALRLGIEFDPREYEEKMPWMD